MAAALLIALLLACAAPAAASANTLYVNFGDSVGAGYGASPGHGYFDLYCAYLTSSSIVNQCINEAQLGTTSASALSGGMVHKVVADIESASDTPIVTVSLGGNDLLGAGGCQPITAQSCPLIRNMRTILDTLETALATRPGSHAIQWLEYYNANHNNPYGSPSLDQKTATLLLGSDLAYTSCASSDLNLIGLNDVIHCIAQEKGATPVDAYTPFQVGCTNNDCFFNSLHPNDKGYGLIFDAFRTTPTSPVPSTPPPDGSWPSTGAVTPPPAPPTLSGLTASRHRFAPARPHHRGGGTVFSFHLDHAAKVRIVIVLRAPGRRVGSSCRVPSRALRHRRACVRTIPITTIVAQEPAGRDRIVFAGRVRGRALRPGSYLASFAAVNGAGAGAVRQLRFTVT